jgi:ABC-type Na+ efflux pump permease subunit
MSWWKRAFTPSRSAERREIVQEQTQMQVQAQQQMQAVQQVNDGAAALLAQQSAAEKARLDAMLTEQRNQRQAAETAERERQAQEAARNAGAEESQQQAAEDRMRRLAGKRGVASTLLRSGTLGGAATGGAAQLLGA